MKLHKYSFSNGTKTIIIEAVDGHRAWQKLKEQVGVIGWHGKPELPLPHSWGIQCVCPCGKVQSTAYCSEACYEAAGHWFFSSKRKMGAL